MKSKIYLVILTISISSCKQNAKNYYNRGSAKYRLKDYRGEITDYNKNRKVLNRDVVATIKAHFKDEVFKTKIRDNIALAEAPSQGLDIYRYNSKSYGAEDYLDLCREIIIRGGGIPPKRRTIGNPNAPNVKPYKK